jgi:hypothetical protein
MADATGVGHNDGTCLCHDGPDSVDEMAIAIQVVRGLPARADEQRCGP